METESTLISPIQVQLRELEKIFFGLNIFQALEFTSRLEHPHSGNLFAIPKRYTLAKLSFPNISGESKINKKLTDLIIKELDKKTFCTDYTSSTDDLFLREKTREKIMKIESSQEGDVIIKNAKISRNSNMSAEQASSSIFFNQFLLDSFTLGCILLTNDNLRNNKTRDGVKLLASGDYLKKGEDLKEVTSFNFRFTNNSYMQISRYSMESNIRDEEFYNPIGDV